MERDFNLYDDFHGKVNQEKWVYFEPSEWECTDRDQFQFCRKIDDTCFEYIQLKESKIDWAKEETKDSDNLLEDFSFCTKMEDWYYEIIDVNDLSKENIDELLDCYGNFGYDSRDKVPNQLIAEAWFEQNTCMEM